MPDENKVPALQPRPAAAKTVERHRHVLPISTLAEQMDAARTRAERLQTRAASQAAPQALLPETLEELQAALEELQVAEEELRQQNEELFGAHLLLEAERQRYQDLFQSAPEGYLVTDGHGMVREVNTAGAALLGTTARALRGKPLANIVAETDRPEFRRLLLTLSSPPAAPVRLEMTLAPRRGSPVPVEATVHRQADAPDALLWIVRDMTAQREEAEAVRRTLAQEQAARAEAEHQKQQMGEMAALLETLLATAPAELFARAARGEVMPALETECTGEDGASCHISTAYYPVRTDKAILGVGIVASDITARKQAEAVLQGAYEREHRIAGVLQRSLLRSVPEDAYDGLSIATFYEAALEEAQVGGDFFDVFTLDSGKVALVVGDVSGKGLAAATCTAEIKYALRAFLRENITPALALARLNNFMCDARRQNDWDEDVFSALAVAVVDAAAGTAMGALAGAEPILRLRAGGGAGVAGASAGPGAGLPLRGERRVPAAGRRAADGNGRHHGSASGRRVPGNRRFGRTSGAGAGAKHDAGPGRSHPARRAGVCQSTGRRRLPAR